MTTSPYISLDKIAFGYMGTPNIITDISLDIYPGETLAIMGTSGSGKSTLLKAIAGLEIPTDGNISFEKGEKIFLSSVGIVFQENNLFPWLTVYQHLNSGKKRTPQEISQMIIHLGLTGSEDTYPHQLSGGMKQRLAIGTMLMQSPSTILLDEPFSSLDIATKKNIRDLLVSSQNSKRTTVFVTHQVDEALHLADKIYILTETGGELIHITQSVEKRDIHSNYFTSIRKRIIGQLHEGTQ